MCADAASTSPSGPPRDITCRQFIDFLDDYVAGDQPTEVRGEFETHIAICRHCADYLRTYRDTIKMGKEAFAADDLDRPVPPSVPEDLVKAVLAATVRQQRSSNAGH